MSEKKIVPSEGKHGKVQPPQNKPPDKKPVEGPAPANPIADLQQQVGNRAVQRLLKPGYSFLKTVLTNPLMH